MSSRRVINCAFIDDDKGSLNIISNSIATFLRGHGYEVNIQTFAGPNQFLFNEGAEFDVIFSDIEMPGMNGISLIEKIRESGKKTHVIFVSNREDKVFESITVHPFGFIRKKNFLADVEKIMGQFINEIETYDSQNLVVKVKGGMEKISFHDIIYVDFQNRKCVIHTSDGMEHNATGTGLNDILESLKSGHFYQVIKGVIVNFEYVQAILDSSVELKDGPTIPVARRRIKEFKDEYLKYATEIKNKL